jgi:membrane protein
MHAFCLLIGRQALENLQSGRGRHAERPAAIPLAGWLDIAVRVKNEISGDRVSLVAAGVGFFALLAAFPALAAFISIYGIFASPADVGSHLSQVQGLLPKDVFDLLNEQLTTLTRERESSLGIAAIIGFLAALWSAKKGTVATMEAIGIAYEEIETRSFFRKLLLSMAFTAGAILYFTGVVMFAIVLPVALAAYSGNAAFSFVISAGQYILLWLFGVAGLSILYRVAPDRAKPEWRWVLWGAAIAATLWMLGSMVFAVYAANAGSYEETYGSLAGVVVFMLWLYMSGFVVVLGAEISAEIEHQTSMDTTTGPDKPLGQRGAYVADTIGAARNDD